VILLTTSSHTRELQQATSQILGHVTCDIFVCVGCVIVAFAKGWELTLGLLASVPPSLVCLNLLGRRIEPETEAQRKALGQAAKNATASLLAIDIVKVYNAHDEELWRYTQGVQQAMRHYLAQALGACSQMAYVKLWMVILFVIGFWLGVYLVDAERTTPGNVLTAFYAVLIAFQSVESLGTQWFTVVKGIAAGKSLMAVAVEPEESVGKLAPGWRPKDICFVDVSRDAEDNLRNTI
jgi:ATP-binding cassette, subfamily B (MDR/TAP), member 1